MILFFGPRCPPPDPQGPTGQMLLLTPSVCLQPADSHSGLPALICAAPLCEQTLRLTPGFNRIMGGGQRAGLMHESGRIEEKMFKRVDACEEGKGDDGKTGAVQGEREGAAGRISDARQRSGAAAGASEAMASFLWRIPVLYPFDRITASLLLPPPE